MRFRKRTDPTNKAKHSPPGNLKIWHANYGKKTSSQLGKNFQNFSKVKLKTKSFFKTIFPLGFRVLHAVSPFAPNFV